MGTNTKKLAAQLLGEQGEEVAARAYRDGGYTIVARNWRCFEGELDVIAVRRNTIAVCEVKTRASARFMDPALSISPSKQSKVRTAAFKWLEENPQRGQLRFDVALVIAGELQLIEGAF